MDLVRRRNLADSIVFMIFVSLVFVGIAIGLDIANYINWPFVVGITLLCVHAVYWGLFACKKEDFLKWFIKGLVLSGATIVVALIYQAYQ